MSDNLLHCFPCRSLHLASTHCLFPLSWHQQVLNALEHRNDNPGAIPPRELAKLVYGPDSVFAPRQPTPEQVVTVPGPG